MSDTETLVDVKFAIAQLGGNSDLLKRMLGKFSAEFLSAPEEIKAFVATGDMDAAKMKVHTAKGLTGNLGMKALYNCSKILEQEMRENNVQQKTLDAFSSLMQQTCDFILTIDLAVKEAPVYSQSKPNVDHTDTFLKRLQRHEFIDDDTLHEYVNSLQLDVNGKKNLVNLVEELQYDKAIEIIKSL